jgi:hypothetical protein
MAGDATAAMDVRRLMEQIMSKTNETSKLLTDSELDVVTGGSFDLGNIVSSVAKATTVGGTPSGAPEVWVGCAWVPQWW